MTNHALARARAGDEDAFRELTDRYGHELQVHICRIVGSAQAAEALLQEILLAAWRGLDLIPRPRVGLCLAIPDCDEPFLRCPEERQRGRARSWPQAGRPAHRPRPSLAGGTEPRNREPAPGSVHPLQDGSDDTVTGPSRTSSQLARPPLPRGQLRLARQAREPLLVNLQTRREHILCPTAG